MAKEPEKRKADERPREQNTRLDLVSEPPRVSKGISENQRGSGDSKRGAGVSNGSSDNASRPFVGVQFECCGIYARIYCNAARTAYVGNCPRCARKIEIKIGPGGSSSRFFTAN
jgi:hypothetical protein